jgi:hypothetical protein
VDGARLEAELRRELFPSHVLHGRNFRAVARRFDCDDVAFDVSPGGLCVVHLTWSNENGPRWPRHQFVDVLPASEDENSDELP